MPFIAQLGGPSALVELSGPARGALSFLLVLAASAVFLSRREATVDRAVDQTLSGSPLSIVYGFIAFGLAAFVGGYLFLQVAQVGVGGRLLAWGSSLVIGSGVILLAGFGYLVVGATLTELEGARRSWPGAVAGAVLSGLPWLVLPPLAAAFVWIAVAAVGLGNPTRQWVHGTRPAEAEIRG